MTDEEILKEYCELLEIPTDNQFRIILLQLVVRCRKEEPRINSGIHLFDYTEICDEDDDMDSYYGKNYFDNS